MACDTQSVEMRGCGLVNEGIEGEEYGEAARVTSEDAMCETVMLPPSSVLDRVCLSSSTDRTTKRNELTRQ